MLDYDPVIQELFNSENKSQEKIALKKNRQTEQLRLAVSNLLENNDAKLFICHILDQTGTFTSSFTGNSATFFLEGKRFIGLYIYQLLMLADPLALQKLLEFRREESGQKT